MPSFRPTTKVDTGLKRLVRRLVANNDADRVDATSCLVRARHFDKLAHGGDRSIDVHLKSIVVVHEELIEDEEVLVLDDVTTSGNSLEACKQLLLQAGARRVQKLALGKTV